MKPFSGKKNNFLLQRIAAPLGVAAAVLVISAPVMADDTQTWPAILRSSDGKVVHDNYGECWGLGANHTATFPTVECGQAAPVAAQPAAPVAPPPPPPAPAPAAPVHVIKHVSLSADVLFDFDKSVVKPAGKQLIDDELGKIDLNQLDAVKVVGNTDSIGTAAYNQKLSERRAEAVKQYMVSKGIAADKITTEGHGKNDPVADNKTKAGRAANRRADITFDLVQ